MQKIKKETVENLRSFYVLYSKVTSPTTGSYKSKEVLNTFLAKTIGLYTITHGHDFTC